MNPALSALYTDVAEIRSIRWPSPARDPRTNLATELRNAALPSPWERRAIREAAGASLRDVAGELGVDPMSVLRWERGETKPRRDRAAAYRKLLDDLRGVA